MVTREPGDDDDVEVMVPLGKLLDDVDHARRLGLSPKPKPAPTLTLEIEQANGLEMVRRFARDMPQRLAGTLATSGHDLVERLKRWRAERETLVDFGESTADIDEVIALGEDNVRAMRTAWREQVRRANQQQETT